MRWFQGSGPRRAGRVAIAGIAAVAGFALQPATAQGCTCGKDLDPTAERARAEVIIIGEVSMVEALPSKLEDLSRATIRVMRVVHSNGHLAGFVRVDTPMTADACGYPFKPGERREFVIRRFGSRFVTTSCLMVGAQDSQPIRPEQPDNLTR